MYSFQERKKLAKQIANVDKIDYYKSLLNNRGGRRTRVLLGKPQELATALVFELLQYYSAQELCCETIPTPKHALPVARKASDEAKKKDSSGLSTQILSGMTSKINLYSKQISSTLTGLISTIKSELPKKKSRM